MKKTIIRLFALVCLFGGSYILSSGFLMKEETEKTFLPANPSSPQTGGFNISDKFIIGALNNGYAPHSQIQDFNFNTWHYYIQTNWNKDFGWWRLLPNDVFPWQSAGLRDTIRGVTVANENNGLMSLLHRISLEFLCFGATSTYEAESEANLVGQYRQDRWFYTYKNTGTNMTGIDAQDNSGFGNGIWGRYCSPNISTTGGQSFLQPGYIVKGLKANKEQSQYHTGSGQYLYDYIHTWQVKPRIRADQNYVNNNPSQPICRIEIIKCDGTELKNIVLKGENFRDGTTPYNGDYIEEFYNFGINDPKPEFGPGNVLKGSCSADDLDVPSTQVDVDYRIWWYGTCDMWLDYVKVENEVAERLFDPTNPFHNQYEEYIRWEVQDVAMYNRDNILKFYVEEFDFNHIPCVAYVNERIKHYSGEVGDQLSLMVNLNFGRSLLDQMGPIDNWWLRMPDKEYVKRNFVNPIGSTELFIGSYPLWGETNEHTDPRIPNTLPSCFTDNNCDYDLDLGLLADAIPPDEYDTWLQGKFDDVSNVSGMTAYMKRADSLSKDLDLPFINLVQAHMTWPGGTEYNQREPTNEEIKMMVNLGISYGARGMLYFDYNGWGPISSSAQYGYGRGLAEYAPNEDPYFDYDVVPRDENVYGQTGKMEKVGIVNATLKEWGPHLMSFDNDQTKSYIYRLEEERNALQTNSYFQDIVSYKPGNFISCVEDSPGEDSPQGYIYECNEDRYLQVATFKNPAEPAHTKYFMIVNRRCSPYIDETTEDKRGGKRKIMVKFKVSSLPEAVNWKLVDLDTGVPIVFSKLGGLVDLGDYMPGEGKLFKMVPVPVGGGTLVDDEVISDDMIITDSVFTDGFNLTIEDGSTITFDTNGVIIAEGGNFTCGDISGTQGVDLLGTGEWNGIKLNACDTVKIYNTNIEDIKDSAYAIDMYNCKNVEMEGNTFTLDNSGAVRGSYVFTFGYFTPTIVLYYNTVNIGANTLPVFNFNANSASSFPVIIDECDMNAPSSSSSSAISITNISGGVIKNNDITGYNTSVLALSSAMDFYNNIISSSTSDCILSGSSGSTLGLKENGGKFTGGENYFSTSHEDANNVEIYGGYFFAEDGYNTFDIGASYDDGKHFSGYFSTEDEFAPSLEYNCFTEDGSPISPVYDITWGIAGDPVSFAYTYDCTAGEGAGLSSKSENNYLIVPITDRYNDTIKIRDGNFTLTASDSMSVEMRKRNYGFTIDIAEGILETTPGNPVAYDALNKLYLASLRLDSAGSKMTPLKAFLEEVILDNGDKPGLVSRAFYFIQKCKAALGQYQSALTGFSDIVTNNPNTYDALVASWDYAATTLLMNGGQGGGDKLKFGEEELFTFHSFSDDPKDQKLSKEQKQQVKINVVRSFEETRKEEINVINKLKEKSDRGDRNAQKELKRRETLQAVVTKRQPADIYEHINNVSSDIRVVFNSTDDNSIKKEQNSIPVEFELSQNFPNPFNPTTKIQYALPKDGKVQLIIYDILGREMAKLVNNEFRSAGRYVSEFNGSRLASGIYFYRIIVNDGKDFNSVKKMVLVK